MVKRPALELKAPPVLAATAARIATGMSDALDQPETMPTRRYLIVGEPRCGGSMLAEALRLTGQAGVPLEYLNPRLVKVFAERHGLTDRTTLLRQYISFLLRRRTTPNGVFMLKALIAQIVPFHRRGPAAVQFLRKFERVVLIHRRDKLAQAVSFYRAVRTDAWTSLDVVALPAADKDLPLDPRGLSQTLATLFAGEHNLRTFGRRQRQLGKPVMALSYEAMQTDFSGSWDRLLAFLDLPPIPAEAIRPTLVRQRDATSDRLMEEYLARLRDSDRFGEFDGR